MNENNMEMNDELELDLRRLILAAWNKKWQILVVSTVFAVLMLIFTLLFVTPQYESSAMFYVNNNAISMGDVSLSSITSSDITASKNLVNSYIVILKTRESLLRVIDYAEVDRTYTELLKMLSAESVDETEIFRVVVTSPDPVEAEKIANAIAYILPKRISGIIEGTSAKVVDSAVIPSRPSSPSYKTNTLVGFLLGFVLSAGVIVIQELLDITIRNQEDVTQICTHPILTAVPDMASVSKGGYDYKYDRVKTDIKSGDHVPKKPVLMGANVSFAASEAYKLLRTKLQFAFAGNKSCRVIGLSSALSGEGKSLTSINLAYTLSQLNKKVILIDCDMRRPTLAEKLNIHKQPGLSSCLTGQSSLQELIQYCGLKDEEQAFHVVAAGQNPPNPMELLSSEQMKEVLDLLRESYDYVILDLPPVGVVSDAMAVAGMVDGILLVVRENYCNRVALSDAVHQFDFIKTKILGVVLNCTNEHADGYYKKGYYKKGYYQKGYYSKGYYGKSYADAEKNRRAVKK